MLGNEKLTMMLVWCYVVALFSPSLNKPIEASFMSVAQTARGKLRTDSAWLGVLRCWGEGWPDWRHWSRWKRVCLTAQSGHMNSVSVPLSPPTGALFCQTCAAWGRPPLVQGTLGNIQLIKRLMHAYMTLLIMMYIWNKTCLSTWQTCRWF